MVKTHYKGAGKTDKSIETHELETYLIDNTQYSPALAQLSMALSLSVFNKECIVNSLENHGFQQIQTYNYKIKLIHNPVYVLAQKTLASGKSIIAVIVRGSSFYTPSDWITDISVGFGDEHKGFSVSAKNVMKELEPLVNGTKDDCMLYMTGHSYGGAVANLLAAKYSDLGYNVFAYTSGTPNVSKALCHNEYNNIFNICNSFDFVPIFPFAKKRKPYCKHGRIIKFNCRNPLFKEKYFTSHHRYHYFNFLSKRIIPDENGVLTIS